MISLCLSFLFFLVAAQEPPVVIASPLAGEVLRGQVAIVGSTTVPDFISAQLDFGYASDPTGTWFPLQTLPQPVSDDPLFTWDTTLVTDGEYLLRLRVFAGDGSTHEATVPVTIQNDALPTATAAPTATPEELPILVPTPFLLAASPTPTELPRPTPTPFPANPASLDSTRILLSLGRGVLVILGLFALAGLILRIRRF